MMPFPSPVTPSGVAAAAPLPPTAPLGSNAAAASVAPAVVESSTVELSRLGLFMSSLALARKRLADQRVATAADAGARASATASADAEAAGQELAQAFNVLRAGGVEASRTPADVLLEARLLHTFTQPDNDSAAAFFTLPQPKPSVAPTPAGVDAARLRVDVQALRAAAEADPRQTLARLERTAEQFAELGAALARPASDIAAAVSASVAAGGVVNIPDDSAADAVQLPSVEVAAPPRTDIAQRERAAAAAPVLAPPPDIDHAKLLARDPAVAAALAAYHLNQGPFRTATNIEPAAPSRARVPAVAPVQAVTPVAAIGDARSDTGPRT
ncbi:hypothetical protein ACFDR9_001315 [Janthinobacterium sp. CG_23.3]|uniref:hypothetical protein n=1 Tax=Janthinobacterium sp. CG_23.3 TaxID=3349634 RepID=UPI0038D41426